MNHYVLPEYPDLCKVTWDTSKKNYPNLELALRFVNRLSDLHTHVYIAMRGSDTSEWADLSDFVDRIPANVFLDIEVGLSRKLIYWESLPQVYNVLVNWTPEMNWRRVLNLVKTRRKASVNLFVDFSRIRLTKRFYGKLKKVGVSAAGVVFDNVGYTEEQLEQILELDYCAGKDYPGELIWEHEITDPAAIVQRGDNMFFGWNCRAGSMRFHIDSDNYVFGAACKVHFAGHFDQLGEISLLSKPLTCPHQHCGDLLDLTIEKWSPDLPTWSTQQIL